jgi:ABC-type branched-subunit amino acid transport system substrate-binding protein
MISVRNRLLQLSGNRWLLFLIIAVASACSPKVRTVTVQPEKKQAEKPAEKQAAKENKPVEPKVSTISLILPFGLDHLKPVLSYTNSSLREADIAVAYYKGFKLALDSLTGKGFNYKLLVFDLNDDGAQAHALAYKPEIRASDLIVGPVFPSNIKAFTSVLTSARKPIVSPLSAASPVSFKNQNLITVTPPLEYHAWAAAAYISDKIRPQKVFILKSGYSEENDYITPFKKAIDSLSKKHIQVIMLTVVHGQLSSLIPQLSATSKNVFIVAANNQHFLNITLHALDSLNNSYPVTLFGHPNWVNFSYLKADLLQRLDTHITSAERIDYKAANTQIFMRRYREVYHTEPTAYAIKGFDEGLYLGELVATDSLKNITTTNFTGLHNSFHFQKKAGLGWINTHVNLYKYANFELKKVE